MGWVKDKGSKNVFAEGGKVLGVKKAPYGSLTVRERMERNEQLDKKKEEWKSKSPEEKKEARKEKRRKLKNVLKEKRKSVKAAKSRQAVKSARSLARKKKKVIKLKHGEEKGKHVLTGVDRRKMKWDEAEY